MEQKIDGKMGETCEIGKKLTEEGCFPIAKCFLRGYVIILQLSKVDILTDRATDDLRRGQDRL